MKKYTVVFSPLAFEDAEAGKTKSKRPHTPTRLPAHPQHGYPLMYRHKKARLCNARLACQKHGSIFFKTAFDGATPCGRPESAGIKNAKSETSHSNFFILIHYPN
jgi:hypothetical protein